MRLKHACWQMTAPSAALRVWESSMIRSIDGAPRVRGRRCRPLRVAATVLAISSVSLSARYTTASPIRTRVASWVALWNTSRTLGPSCRLSCMQQLLFQIWAWHPAYPLGAAVAAAALAATGSCTLGRVGMHHLAAEDLRCRVVADRSGCKLFLCICVLLFFKCLVCFILLYEQELFMELARTFGRLLCPASLLLLLPCLPRFVV